MKKVLVSVLGVYALLSLLVYFSGTETLTGYQVAVPQTTEQFTTHLGGVGSTVIDLKESKIFEKITGRTCYRHKKTGNYYRFKFTATSKGNSGASGQITAGADIVQFIKEFPQSPNWFGGKGSKCHDILIEAPTTYSSLDRLVIEGVNVKGLPSFSADFTVFVKPRPKASPAPQPTPQPTPAQQPPTATPVPTPAPPQQTYCCASTSAVYQARLVTSKEECAKILGGPKCLFPAKSKADCRPNHIAQCQAKGPNEQFTMPELAPTFKPVIPTGPKPVKSCEDSDTTNNPMIAGYVKIKIGDRITYEVDKIEGYNLLETICTPNAEAQFSTRRIPCPPGTKTTTVQVPVDGQNLAIAKCEQTSNQLSLSVKNLKITQEGKDVDVNNVVAGLDLKVEFFIQNDGVGEVTPSWVLKFDEKSSPGSFSYLYSTPEKKGGQNIRTTIPKQLVTPGQHTVNLKVDGTTIDQTLQINAVVVDLSQRPVQTVYPTYMCNKDVAVGTKCLAEGKVGECRDAVESNNQTSKRCIFPEGNLDGCTSYGMPCKTDTIAVNGRCAYVQQPNDLRLNCRAS